MTVSSTARSAGFSEGCQAVCPAAVGRQWQPRGRGVSTCSAELGPARRCSWTSSSAAWPVLLPPPHTHCHFTHSPAHAKPCPALMPGSLWQQGCGGVSLGGLWQFVVSADQQAKLGVVCCAAAAHRGD